MFGSCASGGTTPNRQNRGETTRLERYVLVHGRERDPSKNCAFSSADLPYDCFPGTKMVNLKDQSFEEFSLEGRNTGQGI
jgi:hypothetical protein